MSMSLPLQIAIYQSAVGAAKNNSSAPGPEQVQEVCEACGQVIETATKYTTGEMFAGMILGTVVVFLIAFGLVMFLNWIFDRL